MSTKEDSPTAELLHPSNILVPIDGSENSKRALSVASSLAKRHDAELVILCVIPNPGTVMSAWAASGFGMTPTGMDLFYERQQAIAEQIVNEGLASAQKEGVPRTRREVIRASQSIAGEIIDTATRDRIDLIVIGTRGLGGFKRLLQGSVSSGVVTHAHCNVLVVR